MIFILLFLKYVPFSFMTNCKLTVLGQKTTPRGGRGSYFTYTFLMSRTEKDCRFFPLLIRISLSETSETFFYNSNVYFQRCTVRLFFCIKRGTLQTPLFSVHCSTWKVLQLLILFSKTFGSGHQHCVLSSLQPWRNIVSCNGCLFLKPINVNQRHFLYLLALLLYDNQV
jgi:hypothetical protein